MALSYDEILTRVKLRISVPENQDRILDSDYVTLINQALEETVYPQMLVLNEDFFTVKQILPMRSASGTILYPSSTIPVPKRAYARGIRAIKYQNSTGELISVPQVAMDDLDKFPTTGYENSSSPVGFYFLNDSIVLLGGANNLDGSLVIHFVPKASTIVSDSSAYAQVDSINYASGTFTFGVASVPSYMEAYCATSLTQLFDVYRSDTGALIAIDLPLSRAANAFSTMLLTADDVQNLAAYQTGGFSGPGNTVNAIGQTTYSREIFLVPAAKSYYSVLPPAADNMLILELTGRILESLGFFEDLQVNEVKQKKAYTSLSQVLGERLSGEAKVITNRRGIKGYLRNSGRG